MPITSYEKAEMLKNTITYLYSNENRSIGYISRLLEINRTTLSYKIKHEWKLKPAKCATHLTPSEQKFANKNRQFIKNKLDSDFSIASIAEALNISSHFASKIIHGDAVLDNAYRERENRQATRTHERIENIKENSNRNYAFEDLPGEEWKEILGYGKYMVSNMGRIKSYAKKYDSFYLLSPYTNKVHNRVYIALRSDNGKVKNLLLARIVAHAFVEGFNETNNTVNHIDGNTHNNKASNLEWLSQSDNNKHAYEKLNRTKVNFKVYKFDKILYKNKYEFKTIAAFARFLGKSETQTRRYLDEPKKHEIKLI